MASFGECSSRKMLVQISNVLVARNEKRASVESVGGVMIARWFLGARLLVHIPTLWVMVVFWLFMFCSHVSFTFP